MSKGFFRLYFCRQATHCPSSTKATYGACLWFLTCAS